MIDVDAEQISTIVERMQLLEILLVVQPYIQKVLILDFNRQSKLGWKSQKMILGKLGKMRGDEYFSMFFQLGQMIALIAGQTHLERALWI